MRIGIVVKEFPPDVIGGTEIQTLRMARELAKNHEVIVFTKSYRNKKDEIYRNEKFKIVRVFNLTFNPILSTMSFVLFAPFYVLKYKPDILQCMMIHPSGIVGFIVKRLIKVPYFTWIRGGDYYFNKNSKLKRFIIATLLKDAVVLTQTGKIKRDVINEFTLKNVYIVGNGVDPVLCSLKSSKDDAIGFVGRLDEMKGVDVLIKALEGLRKKLVIIGDGEKRPEIEKLSSELEVPCEFLGFVHPDELYSYFNRFKILVLPSVKEEGLSNAVLEAMSAGIPVICTDVGGMRDVVIDGKNGFVVKPSKFEALREKIMLLMDEVAIYRKMSWEARKIAAEYSWEKILDKLGVIYLLCCNKNGKSVYYEQQDS